jgi:probable rRNA maturation factor
MLQGRKAHVSKSSRSSDIAYRTTAGSDAIGAAEPDIAPVAGESLQVQLSLLVDEPQPPLSGWLEAQVSKIAALAGVQRGRLSLAVVDDGHMAELHEQYKQVPGTTDVLTFDLRDDADGPLEGDVVVCLDEAVRQAQARGHEVRLEVLLYAVHGLLHLLGENDEEEVGFRRMHQREDDLLRAAGFGPVYGSAPTLGGLG